MRKKIIFTLFILVFFCILLHLANNESKKNNNDIITNRETFNSFMDGSFGIVNNTFYINEKGTNTKKRIRGYHGDLGYNWIRAYEIRAPFMDKSFEVWIDNRTHEIFGDNFYEVLSTDPKFQHLYSNWVKKQVGIDDENVELEFKGAMKKSAWVGDKPYIDFDKITSLENLEEQICENTHNLYVKSIDKKITNIETKEEWLQTSKMIKSEYIEKISNANLNLIWDKEVAVKLYYYDVDLVNDRYNHIGLNKVNMNFYYILFNLKNNDIKYLSNYYDCTGATVLQSWLKDIENEEP